MFINRFAWPYYSVQKTLFWKGYYWLFGAPFMSAHIIYALIKKENAIKFNAKIIDFGCGDGVYLNQLSVEKGTTGFGIDKMADRVMIAETVNKKYDLKNSFVVSEFEDIKMEGNSDTALLLDVIEHVPDPNGLIKTISQTLKTGGKLIIQSPFGEDKKYLLKEEKFLYGEDKHVKSGYTKEELEKYLKANGMEILKTIYDFYMISQIIYEMLEIIRRKSQIVYSLLWPLLYPLCWIDTFFLKFGKPNGIFIIAKKL